MVDKQRQSLICGSFAAIGVITPMAHLVLATRDKSADTRTLREDHCAAWFECGGDWD